MPALYIVMHEHAPDSVFSDQAEAEAYVGRLNNLEKQRHPHPAVVWKVFSLDLDVKADV